MQCQAAFHFEFLCVELFLRDLQALQVILDGDLPFFDLACRLDERLLRFLQSVPVILLVDLHEDIAFLNVASDAAVRRKERDVSRDF